LHRAGLAIDEFRSPSVGRGKSRGGRFGESKNAAGKLLFVPVARGKKYFAQDFVKMGRKNTLVGYCIVGFSAGAVLARVSFQDVAWKLI
jgi:hypothetical protein